MPVAWDTTLVSRIHPESDAFAYFDRSLSGDEPVLIPATAVSEVVWGLARGAREAPRFDRALRWLKDLLGRADVAVLPLTADAAFAAGQLRSLAPVPQSGRRDRRRTKPERRVAWVLDMHVAATAWAFGVPVQTENVSDFTLLSGLLAELYPRAQPLGVLPSPL